MRNQQVETLYFSLDRIIGDLESINKIIPEPFIFNYTEIISSCRNKIGELRQIIDSIEKTDDEITTQITAMFNWIERFNFLYKQIDANRNEIAYATNSGKLLGLFGVFNTLVENLRQYIDSKKLINYKNEKIEEVFSNYSKKISNDYEKVTDELDSYKKEKNELLSILNDLKKKSENDANSISELKESLKKEIQDIDERYSSKLANAEIIKQEEIFLGIAEEGRIDRNKALWAIGILTTILLTTIIYFSNSCWLDFECICVGKGKCVTSKGLEVVFYYELLKRITLRLLFISIILFLLKFAVKNYNAIMHNRTINLHKANCFAAAFRILGGLQNDVTKDKILSMAGKEIFEQHRTGYLSNSKSDIDLGFIEKISSIFKQESKES